MVSKPQREMQQAMAEPWVRGIGAARALAALGDAEAAAQFYVACLQMLARRLGADGVPRGHHRRWGRAAPRCC